MLNVKFSVLSYHPSFLTDEAINIGVLFHCEQKDYTFFKKIKKLKRLQSFDDELSTEFVKIFLEGIEEETKPNLFTANKKFNIENYIKFYVNEFKFSKIHYFEEVEDLDYFIEEVSKINLRYDYEKHERLNKNQELSYMNKLLKANRLTYSKDGVTGRYAENIKYDYVISKDKIEYGIKYFEFNKGNLEKFIYHIKVWAFNAEELKDKYKTIITYHKPDDFEIEADENFQKIKNLVEKSSIFKMIAFDKCLEILKL